MMMKKGIARREKFMTPSAMTFTMASSGTLRYVPVMMAEMARQKVIGTRNRTRIPKMLSKRVIPIESTIIFSLRPS
jgi:hypothetical protein